MVTLELYNLVSVVACEILLLRFQFRHQLLVWLLDLRCRLHSLRLCALEAIVKVTILSAREVSLSEVDLLPALVAEKV